MRQDLLTFAKEYQRMLTDHLTGIPHWYLRRLIRIFLKAHRLKRHIFAIGNGSSAALAQHMAVDFNKVARGEDAGRGDLLFKVIPLTDNIPLITAWGNDVSYEYIFVGQLENLYQKGDVLVCISGSGNSPNIIRAAEYVKKRDGKVIALPCFDGKNLKPLADCFWQIPDVHYGRIEDVQQITLHIVSFYLRELAGKKRQPGK